MDNVILPIAIWSAIGLGVLSAFVMALAAIRSVWFGKAKPLRILLVAIPAVLLIIFLGVLETAAQAGIYTVVIMFALVLLGLLGTGLRQLYEGAFG